mgnify:CR=1 FL=1
MKVHKEGTGLLLTLFTILFIVNITLYHTVGKGMLFYSVAFVSTVLFLFGIKLLSVVLSVGFLMIRKAW